jgi:hypothetical protein
MYFFKILSVFNIKWLYMYKALCFLSISNVKKRFVSDSICWNLHYLLSFCVKTLLNILWKKPSFFMVDYDNPKKKIIVEYYLIYICDVLSIMWKIRFCRIFCVSHLIFVMCCSICMEENLYQVISSGFLHSLSRCKSRRLHKMKSY